MQIIEIFKQDKPRVMSYLKTTKEWGNGNHAWVFNYDWNTQNHPYGYAMQDKDGNMVGFLGTIFCERVFDNIKYLYCNLAVWIVNPEYRPYAFLLIKPLLNNKISLTNYTPSQNVVNLLVKLKFNLIKINYSLTSLISPASFIRSLNKRFTIIYNVAGNLHLINQLDQQYYHDHNTDRCINFIIVDNLAKFTPSLVVCFKSKIKQFKILNIAYASNYNLLETAWPYISFKLGYRFKVLFNGEYYEKKPSIKALLRITRDRNFIFYNSDKNQDLLYSEMILTDKNSW